MSEWPMVKLGEVISRVDETEQILKPEDETFVTLKLHGKGVVPRNIGDGKTPKSFRGFRVKLGQFIYSRIDARNGAFGIIPAELDGAVVSKDFPVYEVDSAEIMPSILISICTSEHFVNQIRSMSNGATNRQRIKEDVLERMLIPLPPLGEQNRIAEILGGVSKAIQQVEGQLERTQELSLSVVDNFVKSELVDTQPLYELVEFRGGSTPSKKNDDFWDDGNIRWFTSKDLKSNELVDSIDHVTESAIKNTALKPVSSIKSIVISLRGMSLAHRVPMSVIPANSCVNQDLKALIPKAGMDISVIFALLKREEAYLLTKVATSAHGTKKLDFPHVKNLQIPKLSSVQISKIKLQLEHINKLNHLLHRKLSLLQELQKSLATRAFAGLL